MIARESFEKSWPRLASAAPFLRLMVAHLLCPDTVPPPRLRPPRRAALARPLDEPLVEPPLARQLGVERRHHQVAPGARPPPWPACARQHLDARAGLLDPRRADEHRRRPAPGPAPARRARSRTSYAGGRTRCGAPRCPCRPTSGCAPPVVVAGQHDHPGAGAERRQARRRSRSRSAAEQARAARPPGPGSCSRRPAARVASSPSRSAGARTSTGSAPAAASAALVLGEGPLHRQDADPRPARGARAPRSPPPALQQLALAERRDLEPGHGVLEARTRRGPAPRGRGSGSRPRRSPGPARGGSSLL